MAYKRQNSDEKLFKTDKMTHETKSMETAQKKKMMYVVFISLVIDLWAFTVILPLLPSLLDIYNREVRLKFFKSCAICQIISIFKILIRK